MFGFNNLTFNALDIAVILILFIFVYSGYRKGLLFSIFGTVSTLISMFISWSLFPIVSEKIRGNKEIYTFIEKTIISLMDFSAVPANQSVYAQKQFIEGFNAPSSITQFFLNNNNSEIYNLFKVSTVQDYITSYICNIIINSLSFIVVFAISSLILNIIRKSIRIVKRLPVIGTIDRFGGACCGVVYATFIIWIFFTVATIFFMQPFFANIIKMAESSDLAAIFYKNNLILDIVLKIKI